MKKLFAIFVFIILVSIVYAEVNTRDAEAYKDPKTGETVIRLPKIKYEEGQIPKGENGTLILTYFTKAYVKIYQNSKLDFNVYGDSMVDLVAQNSLILTKVNEDSAEFLLSQDGSDYKPIKIYPGSNNQLHLNFTGKIPFMFIQLYKWRYSENPADRTVTLFFNTPVVPISKRAQAPVATNAVIDQSIIEKSNVKNYNWLYYGAGIIALLIALTLLFKPDFVYSKISK